MRPMPWMVGMLVGVAMMGGAGADDAAAQTPGVEPAGKTFTDFLRESGTKPAVAMQQYQEYLKGKRDTSDTSLLRLGGSPLTQTTGISDKELAALEQAGDHKTLGDFLRLYGGTKPVVAINKYQEYLRRHGR